MWNTACSHMNEQMWSLWMSSWIGFVKEDSECCGGPVNTTYLYTIWFLIYQIFTYTYINIYMHTHVYIICIYRPSWNVPFDVWSLDLFLFKFTCTCINIYICIYMYVLYIYRPSWNRAFRRLKPWFCVRALARPLSLCLKWWIPKRCVFCVYILQKSTHVYLCMYICVRWKWWIPNRCVFFLHIIICVCTCVFVHMCIYMYVYIFMCQNWFCVRALARPLNLCLRWWIPNRCVLCVYILQYIYIRVWVHYYV